MGCSTHTHKLIQYTHTVYPFYAIMNVNETQSTPAVLALHKAQTQKPFFCFDNKNKISVNTVYVMSWLFFFEIYV